MDKPPVILYNVLREILDICLMNAISEQLLTTARAKLDANPALSPNEKDALENMLVTLFDLVATNYEGQDTSTFLKQLSANFLASSHLLSIIQQQQEELNILKKLGTSITGSLDLSTVLLNIANEALRLVKHARTAHIFLYENNQLRFGAASFHHKSRARQPFANPRPNGLTATVARRGEIITVPDMQNHPLFQDAPASWRGSIVGIPIIARNRVVGVMNVSRHTTGQFSARELYLLRILDDHAAIAIENARLHQIVLEQSKRDVLTGLPNRRALDEKLEYEIERARRNQRPFCILMLDLDGFKQINDTYGHEMGDHVLREVAALLNANIRSIDFLARWGGDEMTLVLPETNLDQGLAVGQKLQTALRLAHIPLPEEKRANVHFSGGIAEFPRHGKNAPSLLRAADAALYYAKKHHPGAILVASSITNQFSAP